MWGVGWSGSPQGKIKMEEKMVTLKELKNSEWGKDHLIICGISDDEKGQEVKKQIAETGSVKMTDLAKAMGIDVVEQ